MHPIIRLAVALTAAMLVPSTQAADISVLSGGAAKSAVMPLVRLYSGEPGNGVNIDFATMGGIRAKLKEGARPDVVIMTTEAIAALDKDGMLVPGTATDLARTRIGVAVREGAPSPDVSTPAALRETLLRAKSVAHMDPAYGATSGVHFAGVLKKLGIEDEMKSKSVLVRGGFAAERVANGEAELVVHQISEILPVKGVKIVGPLPAELQLVTTYAAGVLQGSPNADAGRKFLNYLSGPAGRAGFAQAGMEAPQ